jgi:DNA-directed RNA polymerase specialized sigma24 family protein
MNLGIDALRAASRRSRYETAAVRADIRPAPEQNGLEQILRSEKQQRVRAVLAKLKPVQAHALFLHASGHSYRELAESLQIPCGSVGTLLIRAEAEFEKRYLEMYGREEGL